jgi:tripartite-type tricarboxylate transporter receptor subunit TctC
MAWSGTMIAKPKIARPSLVLLAGTLSAFMTSGVSAPAGAESYPEKTIRILVPNAPGGPTDVLARLVGQRLQAALGQNVVVENRAGAAGAIAARAVAGAEPDGYTLFFANTSVLIFVPVLSKGAGYDVVNFAPVAKVAATHQLLVVRAAMPATSVQELVAYAKANPGRLNYSSAGVGNLLHFAGELLRSRAGIDIVHVPYKSGAESAAAAASGHVDFTFSNLGILPLVQDGKLRTLAVTSPARMPELPAVPTLIESGYPDFVVSSFFGLVAPAGTPAGIVDVLNAAINKDMASAQMRTALATLGSEPQSGSPPEFAAFIAAEQRKWAAIANAAGIRLD